MDDIHLLFQQLCGIDTRDVSVPHRLLGLPPSERNAHSINQAAAQLIALVQSSAGRIPSTHVLWMTQQVIGARNAMLSQTGPVMPMPPPVPPVPSTAPSPVPYASSYQPVSWQPPVNGQPTAEPVVVVRPTRSRRGKDSGMETFLGVLGIVITIAGAGLLGFLFRDQLFGGGQSGRSPRTGPSAPPVVVPQGEGRPDARRGPTPSRSPSQAKAQAGPEQPQPVQQGDVADARRHLTNALKNLRKGFFDEADLDAQKALAAAPGMEEAEAMRLTAAYVRQYTTLAEEARRALNQSSEVDLGPKWGRGAFIEQDDGSVTFRVKGKNKRFTIRELDAIPGARYRITASFLDNASNPANDLILGAYQFVRRLDDGGLVLRGDTKVAPGRWLKAASSQDSATSEQARVLLLLADMEFE